MPEFAKHLTATYRRGSSEDAICVATLATQVFLDTYAIEGIRPDIAREAFSNYSPDAFADRLSDNTTIFVLAEVAEHLVGFAEITTERPCCIVGNSNSIELVRLYVQRPFRKLGIGRHLLGEAEIIAKQAPSTSLWFTVWAGNYNAIGFYRSQGYSDIGASTYQIEGQEFENRVFVKASDS